MNEYELNDLYFQMLSHLESNRTGDALGCLESMTDIVEGYDYQRIRKQEEKEHRDD